MHSQAYNEDPKIYKHKKRKALWATKSLAPKIVSSYSADNVEPTLMRFHVIYMST